MGNKKLYSTILASLFIASTALAAGGKPPRPGQVAPRPAPEAITINPASLRDRLFTDNTNILATLNQVYQAKARQNISRANLLPSLNLGGLISGGPSFAITEITLLLPFLFPSNWLDLRMTDDLLVAQGHGYYATVLNVYASALSAYYTYVGDVDLRESMAEQLKYLQQIEAVVKAQYELGLVPVSDWQEAQARAQTQGVQLGQVEELLVQEQSSIRDMLGLPLTTQLTYEKNHTVGAPIENQSPQEILTNVFKTSPEYLQSVFLIEAAKAAKWKAIFSFFSGASLGSSASSSGGLGTFVPTGSLNLTFATFPEIQLSNTNIEAYRIQQRDTELREGQIIESAVGSIREAEDQYKLAADAETNFKSVFQATLMRYRLGLTDLLHLFDASTNATNSAVNRIKASIDVDSQRVNLERAAIYDEFATVKKCDLYNGPGPHAGKLKRMMGFFHSSTVSIDKACAYRE